MFVDRVILEAQAGSGGNGIIAWRREKYIPKGGPYGGDGGDGGSITIIADEQVPSLEDFRYRRLVKAENGQCGGSNQRTGRRGKELVLKVPLGTLIKDAETGQLLHDFTEHGQKISLCRGGKGGKGNARFKTSTNRAPVICTPGKKGEFCKVEFELKLIADVGLVGFPNAGKSTFLSTAADVRVKIAPYPFTTLRPQLGYVFRNGGKRFLLADIPGIIEGASCNRGLGFEFLRHIERTHLLVFVLDSSGIDGRDPTHDFAVLQDELRAYDKTLLEKPFFVALNKCDTEESKEHVEHFKAHFSYPSASLFEISAKTGAGLGPLLHAVALLVQKQKFIEPSMVA